MVFDRCLFGVDVVIVSVLLGVRDHHYDDDVIVNDRC